MSLSFSALIFDFDGVLLESEFASCLQISRFLSEAGKPMTAERSVELFLGLAGKELNDAISDWLDASSLERFHQDRDRVKMEAMKRGLAPVKGALSFLKELPADMPRAICSSSSTAWVLSHLEHLGITADFFGEHVFSGSEHVPANKPNPDIYLYSASKLGVAIEDCMVLEDSPIGARAALASGAQVVGICAGRHCSYNHRALLAQVGVRRVVDSFAELSDLLAKK